MYQFTTKFLFFILFFTFPAVAGKHSKVVGRSGGCGHGSRLETIFENPEPSGFLALTIPWPNPPTTENEMALLEAARVGNAERVAELLEQHVDIFVREHLFQRNALHEAAIQGHIEIVRLILEHAQKHEINIALLHTVDFNGSTALHQAVLSSNPDIFKIIAEYVLATGQSELLMQRDDNGRTPEELANLLAFKAGPLS